MIYEILIEEVISDTFEIEASSQEEALELAREAYHNCEFVLEPGDLETVRACVLDEGGQMGEWQEF